MSLDQTLELFDAWMTEYSKPESFNEDPNKNEEIDKMIREF
jgi:hypothetical protein